MPSSDSYIRDYKQEYKTSKTRGEHKDKSMRNRARRHLEAAGKVSKGDGKDVDHKTPLRAGGSVEDTNLRVRSRSANRSDNGQRKGK